MEGITRRDGLLEQFELDKKHVLSSSTTTSPLNLVYLSIGSFVRRTESVDQQIPAWVRSCYKDSSQICKAKVYLIDPNYLNQIPLALQQELNEWIVSSTSKQSQMYLRGNVELFVSNHAIEGENRNVMNSLRTYIKSMLFHDVKVVIGVFCVPYMIVPENVDIVHLYHSLIEDKELVEHPSARNNLIYFHLADYATRNDSPSTSSPHGTLVWTLKNFQKLNQDEAVMKEYARFEYPKTLMKPESTSHDYNISFGISSYVLHPGTQFEITHLTETTLNYKSIQKQIHEAVISRGVESVISTNEMDINLVLT